MSILDIYASGIDAAAARDFANPAPPPAPSFRLGSFLASGFKSPAAGALESLGSVQDSIAAVPEDSYEQRRRDAAGIPRIDYKALAKGSRAKADTFMPDPETAHWSDQAIAGLGRFGTKAVADVALLGPAAGASVLGLDEANTAAQRLMEKGIDPSTAWKVGGVQGALSAAGAVMPMAGTTLAKTAGLVALGGPASYMAQEAAAREILQRAGYTKEAAGHDPLDPVGLGISTTMAVLFGAAGMRSANKAAESMAKLKKQADVREAVQLSPAEQASSDAFERSAGNLAELRAAVDAEKRPEAKAALQAELDKQTAAAAAAERGRTTEAARPEVVDAARVKVLDDTVARSLPEAPEAHAEMLRAADAVSAGERVDVPDYIPPAEREANFKAWFGESKVVDEQGAPLVVHHGTTHDIEEFEPSTDSRGRDIGVWLTEDPRYAEWIASEGGRRPRREDQNVLPLFASVRNPLVFDMLEEGRNHAENAGLPEPRDAQEAQEILAAGIGINAMMADVAREAKRKGHDGIKVTGFADGFGRETTAWIAFGPEQIKSAIGNSGRFDPNSASLTDPLPPRARALPEATNELPRADEAAAAPERAASAPEKSPEAATAEALAKQSPDLPVRLPGSDKTVALADALEQIKAEAKEEAGFAELVRVAAQCAITGGLTAGAL